MILIPAVGYERLHLIHPLIGDTTATQDSYAIPK